EEERERSHIPQDQSQGYDHHPQVQDLGEEQYQPRAHGQEHNTHDPRDPDCEHSQQPQQQDQEEHKKHLAKHHNGSKPHPGEQTNDHKPHKQQARKGVHWLRRWQEYRRRYMQHQRIQRQRHQHTATMPHEREEDNSILSDQGSI
ncbi:hypothetical protein Pmani_039661, partial [Petrolisthes manimaculis]